MTQAVSLDTCDREPIHVPGSVQPHGFLVCCTISTLRVEQASESLLAHAGITAESALGRGVEDLLDAQSAERIATACRTQELRMVNPIPVKLANGLFFDAVLHRPPDLDDAVVIELELRRSPAASQSLSTFDPRLRSSLLRLQTAKRIRDLCAIAAEEVKSITGFDRVMVYRFDADWNGEVVAESRRGDLEPFLGLHYPASDIPAQARRLYTVNWLRHIVDVGYRPSPIVPSMHPRTGARLDLSHAVLRSVSPIHIEYLKNMGVTASMSISLLFEGKLAGLIACHHYSGPWSLSFQTRETAEYLGQTLSWHLRSMETAEKAEHARRIHATESRIVERLAGNEELLDALATEDLLALVDATGAAVVLREGVRRIGETPGRTEIETVVDWLRQRSEDVYVSDRLQDAFAPAAEWDAVAAGMVAVAISKELGEYLLWFRPSTERTVDWGGDPRKPTLTARDGTPHRLTPRGSFALWRETVRGSSLPWHPIQVEAASALRRVLLGGVRRRSAELRDINERLLEADREKDDFIATVSHELRNPLSAIAGWTHVLRSGSLPAQRYPEAFEVIARNVKSQTDLVEDLLDIARMAKGKLSIGIEDVDLAALVASVVDEVALPIEAKALKLKRILETDARVLGDPGRLRQVVSNLLTNAIKFTPKGGTISVVLRRTGSEVELCVSDTGQGIAPDFLPHIFKPFRQQDPSMGRRSGGLGLGLGIAYKLIELHGGRLVAESEGENRGSTFRVLLPIASASAREEPRKAADGDQPAQLDGLRVLVVEDDADSRELLRVILTANGASPTAVADGPSALAALGNGDFDLLLSDIGLPGMDGFELMRRMRQTHSPSRLPAVALTAYARSVDRTRALRAGFQAHVPKPVEPGELVTVMASVAGRLE
jgi:light-regulated signal transduction histidine kinase (bacteriophytochrome)/CheY-like chemotaxis protein